jgi:hypothetical protein
MDVRELPHMTERVETGAVQFGSQDWPGVFIRGDNAFNYAMHRRQWTRLNKCCGRLSKARSAASFTTTPRWPRGGRFHCSCRFYY